MSIQDDQLRFDQLIWPHAEAVLRMAKFLCGCEADADDLAQEVMLKAFRSLHAIRDSQSVKPWLMSIVRHAHTDRMRLKRYHVQSLDEPGVEPTAPAPADAPFRANEFLANPDAALERLSNEQLLTALRCVPKEIRWTLLLVDVEGLDNDEAAKVLDVPTGTIKSRLHRGRDMLRQALAPAPLVVDQRQDRNSSLGICPAS